MRESQNRERRRLDSSENTPPPVRIGWPTRRETEIVAIDPAGDHGAHVRLRSMVTSRAHRDNRRRRLHSAEKEPAEMAGSNSIAGSHVFQAAASGTEASAPKEDKVDVVDHAIAVDVVVADEIAIWIRLRV